MIFTQADSHLHRQNFSMADKIKSNIIESSKMTRENITKRQHELSRALNEKMFTIAQAKLNEVSIKPTWQEVDAQEISLKHMIQQRIVKFRTKDKLEASVKLVILLLNVYRFLRFSQFLLSMDHNIESEDESEVLDDVSPRTAFNDRLKRRYALCKDNLDEESASFFDYQRAEYFKLFLRNKLLISLRREAKTNSGRIHEAASTICRFGRWILKRRTFELCIFMARFNRYLTLNCKSKECAPPPIPISEALLSTVPDPLPVPQHLCKNLVWKLNFIRHYFFQHPARTAEELLAALTDELLPFTMQGGQLQFEKNYYSLKKGRGCNDLILEADRETKLSVAKQIYDKRSATVSQLIKTYRKDIVEYVHTHHREIEEQRVEYTLRQGLQYLERIRAFKKRKLEGVIRDNPTDLLPFKGRSFEFAEEINKRIHRPIIDLNFKKNQAYEFLDAYNREIKMKIDTIKAASKQKISNHVAIRKSSKDLEKIDSSQNLHLKNE
jgi:hypothetical protein